jgi:hypothetical protein
MFRKVNPASPLTGTKSTLAMADSGAATPTKAMARSSWRVDMKSSVERCFQGCVQVLLCTIRSVDAQHARHADDGITDR